MRLGSLVQRVWIVAAAALLICALEALPGAVAAADDASGSASAGDESPEPLLVSPANRDGGIVSRAERRRSRRQRHVGGQTTFDGGTAVDAGTSRDAAPVPFRIAARDGGFHLPMFTPPTPARPVIAPPPPPPPPPPSGPSTSQPISELGFNTCHKVPAGKRAVKVNLKPDVELPELVAWISSITCKSFVVPGHLSAGGKKVTIVTQGTMTPREAYATFLTALDTLGLTVEQGPGYLKIIETAKAKSASLPVYGFDGQPTEQRSRRAKPAQPGN